MSNDLTDAAALAGFPGAPFTDVTVDAAVASLRNYLGWHVAPEREETLTVDSNGGQYLFLPTLKVTEITAIRDVSEDDPVVIAGWRVVRAGMLYLRDGYWPCGDATVEVDLAHGYDSCPADLLPIVANMAQAVAQGAELTSVRIDDYAETYADRVTSNASRAVGGNASYYKVPRRTR